MTQKDVIDLYRELDNAGIKIWIDGGFCVDALLEKQLRPHNDLDIAIQWKDVSSLKEILSKQGYKQIKEDSQWNFVLGDEKGHEIDVHAFVYDQNGKVVDGIMYPTESLSGHGVIESQSVNCISPKDMVEFLAPWISKWPDKYLPAVSMLCEKFQIKLPKEYTEYKK
ncbi:MAG: nucleotidyltransferase family protein [Candidatus Staskawiczbacteria bacterium]|nr:nucleotidyltransferase family protein [Candidatus Staskawiczbacteria bacterium]